MLKTKIRPQSARSRIFVLLVFLNFFPDALGVVQGHAGGILGLFKAFKLYGDVTVIAGSLDGAQNRMSISPWPMMLPRSNGHGWAEPGAGAVKLCRRPDRLRI